MLKNNSHGLIVLILSCLILFLVADVASELLASLIIFSKRAFSHLVGMIHFHPS